MDFAIKDIIVAISTAQGQGGIAIVRLSGEGCHKLARPLFAAYSKDPEFEPYRLYPGKIIDPEDGQNIDEALYVRFKAPHSFTREEVVELQIHGGRRHAAQVVELLIKRGARLAGPGEFSLRAFLNGRIDLTRAEATADLIEAQSDGALLAARRQLDGQLFDLCEKARQKLSQTLSLIEAYIDFPEEDLSDSERISESQLLKDVRDTLAQAADTYKRGRIVAEGALVVIAGAPNAGKSSLMNRLSRSERSIVDEQPGTTRDIVEHTCQIGGVAVRLADTAGLRDAQGVEARGVKLAWDKLDVADIVIWVLDNSKPEGEEELLISEKLKDLNGILLLNKCDRPQADPPPDPDRLWAKAKTLQVSAKTGDGVEQLEKEIEHRLLGADSLADVPLVTSARHHAALEQAANASAVALEGLHSGLDFELIACDLREALDALARLVGVTTNEELLDGIFSRFCIGK